MLGGRLRALKVVVDLYLRWKKYLARKKYLIRTVEYCPFSEGEKCHKIPKPAGFLLWLRSSRRNTRGYPAYLFPEKFSTNAKSVG